MPKQILAHRKAIGAVSRCSHDCFHLQVGRLNIALTEVEYMDLVALINESVANCQTLRHPKSAHCGLESANGGRVESMESRIEGMERGSGCET